MLLYAVIAYKEEDDDLDGPIVTQIELQPTSIHSQASITNIQPPPSQATTGMNTTQTSRSFESISIDQLEHNGTAKSDKLIYI